MTTAPKVQSELKPCPFCGETCRTVRYVTGSVGVKHQRGSKCRFSDRYSLATDWNTRPIEAALAARCERLETVLADKTRELEEARQYGPKWWPADKEIEDGWEETEFYTNDYQYVLVYVVPPAPEREGGG